MGKEIEIRVSKVREQNVNGTQGKEVGKAKTVRLKKNDDGSVDIGGQNIRDVERKKNTLTGETTVVTEGGKKYDMAVEVTIDCSTDPPTLTIKFFYWGERFKEVDEITSEEQDKLLGWLDENGILAMIVLPDGNGLPPPGLRLLAFLNPEDATDPIRIGEVGNRLLASKKELIRSQGLSACCLKGEDEDISG